MSIQYFAKCDHKGCDRIGFAETIDKLINDGWIIFPNFKSEDDNYHSFCSKDHMEDEEIKKEFLTWYEGYRRNLK